MHAATSALAQASYADEVARASRARQRDDQERYQRQRRDDEAARAQLRAQRAQAYYGPTYAMPYYGTGYARPQRASFVNRINAQSYRAPAQPQPRVVSRPMGSVAPMNLHWR